MSNEYTVSTYREIARSEARSPHRIVIVDGWVSCECGESFAHEGTGHAMHRNHCEERAIDMLCSELSLESDASNPWPKASRKLPFMAKETQ